MLVYEQLVQYISITNLIKLPLAIHLLHRFIISSGGKKFRRNPFVEYRAVHSKLQVSMLYLKPFFGLNKMASLTHQSRACPLYSTAPQYCHIASRT